MCIRTSAQLRLCQDNSRSHIDIKICCIEEIILKTCTHSKSKICTLTRPVSVVQWLAFSPRVLQIMARFEPRSGQIKDYEIGICCFSAKYEALRRKSKDWLARNQDNVSEWATCLFADCCFSELVLKNPIQVEYRVYTIIITSKCNISRLDITEKLFMWSEAIFIY